MAIYLWYWFTVCVHTMIELWQKSRLLLTLKILLTELCTFGLITGCSFGFTSSEGQPNFTTAIAFFLPDGTELTEAILYDFDISNFTDATIRALNGSQGVVSGSFCRITSLEVYRGADDITEIRSDGLSLSNAGTLNVS